MAPAFHARSCTKYFAQATTTFASLPRPRCATTSSPVRGLRLFLTRRPHRDALPYPPSVRDAANGRLFFRQVLSLSSAVCAIALLRRTFRASSRATPVRPALLRLASFRSPRRLISRAFRRSKSPRPASAAQRRPSFALVVGLRGPPKPCQGPGRTRAVRRAATTRVQTARLVSLGLALFSRSRKKPVPGLDFCPDCSTLPDPLSSSTQGCTTR